MNTIPHHSKETIIKWLERNIANERRSGGVVELPCIEGIKDTLTYLRESDAKPTEVKSVSKGEIDTIIQRMENSVPNSYDILTLINYVKTAALMPAEPDMNMLACVASPNGRSVSSFTFESSVGQSAVTKYKALYEHLTTPPKPKMKKVWCVAYTVSGRDVMYKAETQTEVEAFRNQAAKLPAYTHLSPIWEQEVEDK